MSIQINNEEDDQNNNKKDPVNDSHKSLLGDLPQHYQIIPRSKPPLKSLSLPLFNTQSSPPVSPFPLTPTISGSPTTPVFLFYQMLPEVLHEALEPPTLSQVTDKESVL